VVAPVLALLDQIVSFATVGWACAHQHGVAVHAVHALFLVAAVASTVPAFLLWRGEVTGKNGSDSETVARRHFLASVACCVGALSVVVIAAMWMPTWVIAVCAN
jgi:surface polysaccharide O-acyltransferase-like enzyme